MTELKQLSGQLKTDAEFLAHPDVRRAREWPGGKF